MASRSRVSAAREYLGSYRSSTVASGSGESAKSAGALAAATWLSNMGATPPAKMRWHVEIALDVVNQRAPSEFDEITATRFHLDIYSEEWGFYFCHAGRCSWIRVTDIAFVHGRDDFQLLGSTPPLKDIGVLIRRLEQQHRVHFHREHASVKTNVPGIEPSIRQWIASL